MRRILYYEEGLPKVLDLDEHDNLLFHGSPNKGEILNITRTVEPPLEIFDPSASFEGKLQDIHTRLHRDFANLMDPSVSHLLTPLRLFKMLHSFLREYEAHKFLVHAMTKRPLPLNNRPPVRVPPVKEVQDSVSFSEDERQQFFDLNQECPREEWESIREAYKQELSEMTSNGCSSCELNNLMEKYKEFLNA